LIFEVCTLPGYPDRVNIYGYIQDFWRRPRALLAVPAPIEA
jgi:hypothetical protein